MLPKSLHLGQPCRQVDHRLSPPRAASCRPTDCQGSAAGRGRRCQAGAAQAGAPLGASRDHKHVCRSHLQGSFNYQTTTFSVLVCVRQATACGAQLTMQLSPSPCPPTRSMACLSCLCTACRGPITAPALCHSQRRRRRAKVVARCGSTHTQAMLVSHGGCLVPLSWVCGWGLLREDRLRAAGWFTSISC